MSHRTRETVIERYGIDPDKVETVHNAVEFASERKEALQCPFPEKVVTFLGRVTFQKGPDYFVEAAWPPPCFRAAGFFVPSRGAHERADVPRPVSVSAVLP